MDEVNASAIQLNNTLSQSNGTPQHPDSQTASEYALLSMFPPNVHSLWHKQHGWLSNIFLIDISMNSYNKKLMRVKLSHM